MQWAGRSFEERLQVAAMTLMSRVDARHCFSGRPTVLGGCWRWNAVSLMRHGKVSHPKLPETYRRRKPRYRLGSVKVCELLHPPEQSLNLIPRARSVWAL